MAARKRRRREAPAHVHEVRAKLDVGGLGRAGNSLFLLVEARGRKLGELEIGRGALYWYGRNARRRRRISWTRFAELMNRLSSLDIR